MATATNYWTQASGALYPATITDEVRIGQNTDLGAYKLQVNAPSVFRLRLDNTSQDIDFITTGTGTQPYFKITHDGSGGLVLGTWGGFSFDSFMQISASSRTPQFPAGLILGTSFSTSTAGSMRWNGTNFQGYNGSVWVNLDAGGSTGMTDPMTTRGDIIYRNSSNVTARLGRGTAGQLLYSNGTDLSWRTPVKADIGLGNVENTALSTWTGSTNIGTVGSITQGNWGGDPISAVKGGTGKTSYTAYALLAGGTTSTGTLQQVAGVGTAGQVLTSNGVGALPSWQAAPSGGSGGWLDEGNYVRLNTFADRVTIGGGSDPNPFKLEVVGDGKFDNIQTGYITSLSGIRLGSYTPGQYATMGTNTLKHLQYVTPTTDIYILTPQVRINALNASSMRYYDGRNITDTLTVNTIYYITHVPQGGDGEILVKQDGTGGRTLTLYFYDKGQTGEPDANIELTKVTVGATTAIKATANKHTLIRYRRWGTKVTLEYLQEP